MGNIKVTRERLTPAKRLTALRTQIVKAREWVTELEDRENALILEIKAQADALSALVGE